MKKSEQAFMASLILSSPHLTDDMALVLCGLAVVLGLVLGVFE